ncbi:MAG: hypothetical protein EBY65_07720 [Acidimicrobiia bacterium]|nr:hypothetical protein [Acidimicrobiia bacterium]
MAAFDIRVIGDPVLRQKANDVAEIDGALVKLVDDEGCLSVPGLSWEIVRPKKIHIVGRDLDGNEMTYEADELESRMFQHEMDHLNGVLLIERLDEDTRKAALKTLRDLQIGTPETKPAGGGLTLP